MKLIRRFSALAVALVGAASLSAQQPGRAVVFQAFGGGASHLRNLTSSGDIADFKMGFNIGGAVGIQVSDYVGVHGDFTWTRNQARGSAAFVGRDFDRFFYGAHLEVAYPAETGFAPFLFGGGGAVTVHEAGSAATVSDFTRPAAMFGAGFRYLVPNSRVEVLAEGKSLVYKWEGGGYTRTQWDLSYSVGLGYRFGF